MTRKQVVIQNRYFVWRYANEDEHGDQLQKGIQEYIKRYQTSPHLILVPKGFDLLPPMGGLEIRQDQLILPFRLYFALKEET